MKDNLQDALSDYFSRIGRKGGHARAKNLTPRRAQGQRHEGIEGSG